MMSCASGNSRRLSIKFMCVTLPYMSICAGVVVAVTFQQVDHAPYAQTCSKADDNRTELRYRGGEKLHKRYPPAGIFPRPSRIRETLAVQLCKAAAKAGASQA